MLSIIIVNWKSIKYLKKCINSIYKYLNIIDYEIIVADNNSGDDFSQINSDRRLLVLQLDKNYGFAKANNIAFKKSKGDTILFLNPDTEFIDSSIINSYKHINEHQDIGVLGCKILNPDKTVQQSVNTFPTLFSHILILLKLHRVLKNNKALNRYYMKNFDYSKGHEVDQVMGSFFMTKREVFENMNNFDENYFTWYEEVDFCKKVKNAGYKVVYFPYTQIIHYYSQSFKKELRVKKQLILTNSMRYYFKKNSGIISYLLISLFSILSLLITVLIKLIYKEKVVISKRS